MVGIGGGLSLVGGSPPHLTCVRYTGELPPCRTSGSRVLSVELAGRGRWTRGSWVLDTREMGGPFSSGMVSRGLSNCVAEMAAGGAVVNSLVAVGVW